MHVAAQSCCTRLLGDDGSSVDGGCGTLQLSVDSHAAHYINSTDVSAADANSLAADCC